ncbi:MAG: CHASE2 domain-containing protein, partial [Terriglobales bacterium]
MNSGPDKSAKSYLKGAAWPCALLATLVGLALLATPFGAGLQRWAFDLLFVTRQAKPLTEAVIVYMDEPSFVELGQIRDKPWSRALHGQFLRRMKEAGAKAVVFDIVFSDPGDSLEDGELASAIKEMGAVYMGADLVETPAPNGLPLRTLSKPIPAFLAAGVQWGIVSLIIDPDYAIRRQFPPDRENLTLAMAAAKGLTGQLPVEQSYDHY